GADREGGPDEQRLGSIESCFVHDAGESGAFAVQSALKRPAGDVQFVGCARDRPRVSGLLADHSSEVGSSRASRLERGERWCPDEVFELVMWVASSAPDLDEIAVRLG
ncbi:MAG: hypothetical protein O2801_09410, partial [Actinomycetota bacterium]|nr:hypothetical protein [Actinomycetota bacterium]